jgi:catechol 2,3-dioxygenase-like lactoylglutathione lyase family enzyme
MTFVFEGLNHHGITFADIERSLEFFVGVLGLRHGPIVELGETFAAGVTGVQGARIRLAFVHGPGFDVTTSVSRPGRTPELPGSPM